MKPFVSSSVGLDEYPESVRVITQSVARLVEKLLKEHGLHTGQTFIVNIQEEQAFLKTEVSVNVTLDKSSGPTIEVPTEDVARKIQN